jgi:hypothetical protein
MPGTPPRPHVGQAPLFQAPDRAFVVLPTRWIIERTNAWTDRPRRRNKGHDRDLAVSEAWIWLAEGVDTCVASPRNSPPTSELSRPPGTASHTPSSAVRMPGTVLPIPFLAQPSRTLQSQAINAGKAAGPREAWQLAVLAGTAASL